MDTVNTEGEKKKKGEKKGKQRQVQTVLHESDLAGSVCKVLTKTLLWCEGF